MEDATVEENREAEVAPALISVHPAQESVAVAVGSDIRIFDLQEGRAVSLLDDTGEVHKDSIRAIRYGGPKGKLFASAGDDKLVKIWSSRSWRCICSVVSEKRVSAVAIAKDGQFVCYADKFGVVYGIDIQGCDEEVQLLNKKPIPILAHYCSIITSLEFSPDGRFIVSADRDSKIRVSELPKNPLDGAHEIQSYCLGHTEFVSSLAFVSNQDCPEGLLISGSGDSTVRLWNFTRGSLLASCCVGKEAGLVQSNGHEVETLPAVTDLCASHDGSLVASAMQSVPGVMLLRCNISAGTLSFAKVISVGDSFIPTNVAAASSANLLWMVMGASGLDVPNSTNLARLRLVSGFAINSSESSELDILLLADEEIPGGELLLQHLQGSLSIDEAVFSTAAELVKRAMSNLLIKKHYSTEKREFRKRGRNDKKRKG